MCLPAINVMLQAKEMAMICKSITRSRAPNTGDLNAFAPTTSIQVMTIIINIPAIPIHSNQALNR
jgi:hypothetical protein